MTEPELASTRTKRTSVYLAIVIALTLVATLLRFVALEKSPPGFYIDEAAIAAQVICLRQSGRDLAGHAHPLFSEVLGGGLATPATLYGGAVWTGIFGDSIASFRAFAALHGALTVFGIFALALALWRRKDIAWVAALCVAISPWGFQFSRIAWDPALAPCYFVWGLALILFDGRFRKTRALLGGVLLSLACYSYPTTRVQAALLLPAIFVLAFVTRRIDRKILTIAATSFIASLIPLIWLTATGEIQGRFNVLSITNADYLQQFGGFSVLLVAELFLKNIALNLSPKFLFLTGDANLRHATQIVGQWSWLEITAIGAALALAVSRRKLSRQTHDRSKEDRYNFVVLALIAWAYLAAIIPAAMTWESNPHALRSIGAYPFLALGAGYVLAKATDQWRIAKFAIVFMALAFSLRYFTDFFTAYPARTTAWFDADVAASPNLAPADYAKMALEYYSLRDGKTFCYQPPK